MLALLTLTAATAEAQTFAPANVLTAAARSVVIGDFNGDGVPDLATVNPGSGSATVSILLGVGDGTFGPKNDFPAVSTATSMTTGDFNRDGKLDLAVSNSGSVGGPSQTVSVFLANGDGTLQPKNDFPIDPNGLVVIAGDFNNDGNPDLAVACTSVIDVLLGNGDGTFRPKTANTLIASASALVSGDFNGDGRPDLAAASSPFGLGSNGVVDVLLGNGDGTFQSATTHFACGVSPQGLDVGDFNGDGKLDWVTANQLSLTVTVRLGNGDGTFQPKLDLVVGESPTSVKVADLNGDGKADITLANLSPNLVTLLGNGDGTFRPPVAFDAGGLPSFVTTGDLNRDGKPDLIGLTRGSGIGVLLNTSGQLGIDGTVTDENGAPLAGVLISLSGTGVATTTGTTGADGRYSFASLQSGASYTVTPSKVNYSFAPPSQTFNNFSSNQTANFAGTLLRFNISGVVTIVGSSPGGVTVTLSGDASAVTTTAADGSYSFTSLPASHNYTVTPTLPKFVFSPSGSTFTNLSSNRRANFTGSLLTFKISGVVRDSSKNAALSGLAVTLSGSKTAATTTASDGSYSFPGLTIGGDYTVTVSPRPSDTVFQNYLLTPPLSREFSNLSANATADFGATLLVNATNPSQSIAAVVAGDFNGDGKIDLAASYRFGNGVSILLGNGDGTFQAERRVALAGTTDVMVAGDFDGDGKLDLALPNPDSVNNAFVAVLFGNGDATFQQKTFALPVPNPFSFAHSSRVLVAADLNRDGRLDLIEAGSSTDINGTTFSINVLSNNGGRDFTLLPATSLQSLPHSVRAADFNGDGKPDLVVASDTAPLSIFLGKGDGTFAAPSNINLTGNPGWVAVGDFNGDGKLDLAAHIGVGGTVNVLLGNGDGTFQTPITFNAPGSVLVAADFNGDGKLDLAVLNVNAVKIDTFFGKGDGTFSAAASNAFNTNPGNLVAGDFNGDGAPDLAVADIRNSQNDVAVLLDTNSVPAVRFSASTYNVNEKDGAAVITVTRTGDLSRPASVEYSTSDVTASERSDYTAATGTLSFAAGESSKNFTIFVTDDALTEGSETLTLGLGNPAGASLASPSSATLTIANDDGASATTNPADDASFFVRQHYRDFLNRDPDPSGLQFWTQNITSCGDANCVAVKRVNTSAAFFLSIEFQETGYLVERIYKAAFGDAVGSSTLGGPHQLSVPVVRLREFLRDTQEIGSTPTQVIVGVGNWQQQLEDNKNAFALEFVS
ncbi:MAG TPA: FG-GAP-like repeat-containing protein, partial [Pyrinomonadaceae bacterium]|nr:FG-GAP-like repeat-containing protein [Pyrinomonadaceae bacterium]